MSLLSELEARGVTAEDLKKAASVRHFEKAAAAEGVNLDELGEAQVEELYASFIHNQTSAEDIHSKEASAMNDEIVDLFEKTAAAEGIDLDAMDDTELAELYNHYVENVLPEQIGEKSASAVEDEAYEKLAEAEILGRHMARAYMDELDESEKIARARWKSELGVGGGSPKGKASGKRWQGKYRQEAKDKLESAADSVKARKRRATRGGRLAAMGGSGSSRKALNAAAGSLTMKDKARSLGERSKHHLAEFAKRNPRLAKAAPYAGAAGAAGAIGYGAYRAGKGEKAASAIEDDAILLAHEMLKSASGEGDYEAAVEERAFEILAELGLD